jgi:hypothetical protein
LLACKQKRGPAPNKLHTANLICLIALLDNPFRGEVSVSPAAFELIYSQMMKE